MKRIIIVIILLIVTVNSWGAFKFIENLVGLTAVKNDNTAKFKELNGDVSGLKADVNTKIESLIKELNMQFTLQAEVNSKIQAQIGSVQAKVTGLDKSVTEVQTAGRDIITTNDTDLMKEIFKGLFALMTVICSGLFVSLKNKDKYIKNLQVSNDKKQAIQDKWERDVIGKLVKKELDYIQKSAEKEAENE